jgi:hypothetical protein
VLASLQQSPLLVTKAIASIVTVFYSVQNATVRTKGGSMIIAAIGIAAVVIGAVYAAVWTHRKCQQIEATLDSTE